MSRRGWSAWAKSFLAAALWSAPTAASEPMKLPVGEWRTPREVNNPRDPSSMAGRFEAGGTRRPFGREDFSIAGWVNCDDSVDVAGEVVSQFDARERIGWQLGLIDLSGVTSHQPNRRNLYFGLDSSSAPQWEDCGRPGNAVYICALCVHAGNLYAGTFEVGGDHRGRVYRYEGKQNWADVGAPGPANAVLSLAVYQGKLYAGDGRYKAGGSALVDSPNQAPGGAVYRMDGEGRWTSCGKLGDADAVMGLAEHRGGLYAIPLYHRGVYRYEGDARWTSLGDPGRRTMAIGSYHGKLTLAGNEGAKKGGIFEWIPPASWRRTGVQPGVDQVYSFAMYGGDLFAGTWPEAKVFRRANEGEWADVGRLGSELEVMGMATYNGKLYAGTLPLAEVYRYEEPLKWTKVGRIDHTPDVRYRRAWSMAIYQGRLFCGTLPSGRVHAVQTGQCITVDRALPSGWRFVVATRKKSLLQLYVDGRLEAQSPASSEAPLDVSCNQPLQIGGGTTSVFRGRGVLQLYRCALTESQVAELMKTGPPKD